MNIKNTDLLERIVEIMAYTRRSVELLEGDSKVKEFDDELNRLCEKYYNKFAELDVIGLMMYGINMSNRSKKETEDSLDDLF